MQKDERTPLVQNYMRLQHLLNYIALPLLRTAFINNWKTTSRNEWTNSEISGAELISDIGANLFKTVGKMQKELLKSGDIEKWDLPLVIDALKCLPDLSETTTISIKEQHNSFYILKQVRNQLSHHAGLEIDNEMFENMWRSTAEVLIKFGVSHDVIDKAKIVSMQENKENIATANKLKVEGNLQIKNSNYSLAVSKYTEAIKQEGLPAKESAILYSNRSFAYLKQGDNYAAKDDAKVATLLNPNWWRAFDRLGQAYLKLEKYKLAQDNFVEAIRLNPDCKLQNERDHCIDKLSKIGRKEHFDTMNYTTTLDQYATQITNIANVMTMLKQRQNYENSPSQMCDNGHKYLQGLVVPQSYEIAAQYYAKAATQGSAEGYYNLALLTREGKGVKLNVAESIRLLERAASQDICMDVAGLKLPNIGVVEAEHGLGLSYQEGVGVPQDFQKALNWYTRAIKHGSGAAATNVGFMYDKGIGVTLNKSKALDYYKLASSMKVVRAMEIIAYMYLELDDKENARKWFQYAINKGSLALQATKQDFFDIVGTGVENTIEEDVFELELIEEVKAGPLAHMIVGVEELPMSEEETINKFCEKYKIDRSGCVSTSRTSLGLTDPYRVKIITSHRYMLREIRSQKPEFHKGEAKLLPKQIVDIFTLKQIFFADMDTKKDHIYEGCAIKLTLIEDAITATPSISQIAEDGNGDAQRICFCNFPRNKEIQDSIGFGCSITVVNPYFRLANDGLPVIRVDDVSLMVLQPSCTDKKKCRYCGKTNDLTVPCRHCKRCFYCSKLCLKKDSAELNHKDVCLKRL